MLTIAFYRLSDVAAAAAMDEIRERIALADEAEFPAPAEISAGADGLVAWSATNSGSANAGLFEIEGQHWLALAGRPSRGMVYVPPFGGHYKPLYDTASPAAVLAAALNADVMGVAPVAAADVPAAVRGWALAEAAEAPTEYGESVEITVFPGPVDLRAEVLRTLGEGYLPPALWAEFVEAAQVAARVDRRSAVERGLRALAGFPGARIHRALLGARLAALIEPLADEHPFRMQATRHEKAAASRAAAEPGRLPAHLHVEAMRATGSAALFAAAV